MIQELTVENIAIIDKSEVQFGLGFTALTGETGAGKSLLIDSIGLALGGRADSDLVRTGALKGVVTLLADLRANPMALAKCAEHGIEVDNGQLVIHREVSAEGRSTVRLNGKLAAVGTLREIGALLIDLHGQHDHQSLMYPERQIEFLDAWIGDPAAALLAEVDRSFQEVESIKRRLQSLRSGRREREQRLDTLKFQVAEIEEAAVREGEMEELRAQLERLKNAERLGLGAESALLSLADDDSAAVERLRSTLRELESLQKVDPGLDAVVQPLRDSYFSLEDVVHALRGYATGLDADAGTLEVTAARIDLLQRLRRKYGDDEAAVLHYLLDARREIEDLELGGMDESDWQIRLDAAEEQLKETSDELSALRRQQAAALSQDALVHIRDLAMEKALFEVRVEEGPTSPTGQDRVEFYFTAHPGESLRPLAKVASGGELSRVMLAIKVSTAGRGGVPTLIFDEVDTGLSGRAAAITARKLEELARFYQVIVISHLPQIAGRAEHHFRIEKVEQNGRVLTRVRQLRPQERVEEVARLLAGEKVSETALANARELLVRDI